MKLKHVFAAKSKHKSLLVKEQEKRARGELDIKKEKADGGKRDEKRGPSEVARTRIRAGDH